MGEASGKTFVVTGANSGVGLETARDRAKGERAAADVRDGTGGEVRLVMLDLADLGDVARAAEELAALPRLDVLVNNAGLGTEKEAQTKDGFELTMGTNHVGPFALTEALLPRLLETAERHGEARVVNVSSLAHRVAFEFDPDRVASPTPPRGAPHMAYAHSKLANLLHARELAFRFGANGLRAHAVHPGYVASNFFRPAHASAPMRAMNAVMRPIQVSPEKGARPSLHCALSEEAGRLNGRYWVKERTKAPRLPDDVEAVQRRLWEATEAAIARARA